MYNKQGNTSGEETQPLVSFIVTYHNQPLAMLCECINSILQLLLQSSEREIIVIDDGSLEIPTSVLKQYGNDITYVRQSNSGVSVARNTALYMARGTFIQIIDADDALIKSPYEHCINIIRNTNDIDMLIFDFSNSPTTSAKDYKETPLTTGSHYLRHNNIRGSICCCLFRQSIRGKLEFSPGIAYGEDEEFTPQLLVRAESVCATDAKAYFYRQHNSSAVHQTDDASTQKRLEDTFKVILNLNNIADTLPKNDCLAIKRRVAQLTMDHIYNTIMLTNSQTILNQQIELLRQKGLFPLPYRNYSTKYKWFRRLTSSSLGRSTLLHILPLLKKER